MIVSRRTFLPECCSLIPPGEVETLIRRGGGAGQADESGIPRYKGSACFRTEAVEEVGKTKVGELSLSFPWQ